MGCVEQLDSRHTHREQPSPIYILSVTVNPFFLSVRLTLCFNLIEGKAMIVGGKLYQNSRISFFKLPLFKFIFTQSLHRRQLTEQRFGRESSCSLVLLFSNLQVNFPWVLKTWLCFFYSPFVLESEYYYSWVLVFTEGWERERLSW